MEPEKVASIEEARRLAEATGRVVYYEIRSPNADFFPELGFFGSLRLRFWLLRKRVQWSIQKLFARLKK